MKFKSAFAAALLCSSAPAAQAWAHAEVSPPVAQKGAAEVFTLAVPTEADNATTTKVELTVPAGFGIDSFEAEPGWKRSVQATGSGEAAVVQKVTWTGGRTPTGEDSIFRFLATASKTGDYAFRVRQTYSNGQVVDWSGPESSDTPSPAISAVTSLAGGGGGGGGSSTADIIAVVLAALAVVLSLAALLGRSRDLT